MTRTLYAAVRSAARASHGKLEDDDLFLENYAAAGVSANLCEALAKVGGDDLKGYELRFAWAPDLAEPADARPEPVRFSAGSLAALKSSAARTRARLGRRNAVVHGSVIRLVRRNPEGFGEVTILGFAEGDRQRQPRHFRASLGRDDYARAMDAHHNGVAVEVQGDIEKRSSGTVIQDVRSFALLPDRR